MLEQELLNPQSSDLSIAVLAGGQSSRMKSDKAFLKYDGDPFIRVIVEKMESISDEVVVVIGEKGRAAFEAVLDDSVRVVNDLYHLGNPLGGILTAIQHSTRPYVAFIACDMPLVRTEVVSLLYRLAQGRSAAVPTWEAEVVEPLCAVYDRQELAEVSREVVSDCAGLQKGGCRKLLSILRTVEYVGMERIRTVDPELISFTNVNQEEDYDSLLNSNRMTHRALPSERYVLPIPQPLAASHPRTVDAYLS